MSPELLQACRQLHLHIASCTQKKFSPSLDQDFSWNHNNRRTDCPNHQQRHHRHRQRRHHFFSKIFSFLCHTQRTRAFPRPRHNQEKERHLERNSSASAFFLIFSFGPHQPLLGRKICLISYVSDKKSFRNVITAFVEQEAKSIDYSVSDNNIFIAAISNEINNNSVSITESSR